MSTGAFEISYQFTLGYERGYSHHPSDPGGATQDGITQAVYDDDRDLRGLPRRDVRVSTEAERRSIYRRRYWTFAGCDNLPAGVDYALFDFAVNSGVGRSVKTLQMIVGTPADGACGPRTVARVQGFCADYGPTALTDELCQERMRFLRGLRTFATFGEGWSRRVMGRWDGTQSGDTGVIDRAYDLARGRLPTEPAGQMPTPKTYLARTAA
ncbi:MAG TPA: glycosyl hydrolase 108 family protein [Frateuria sp.]|uniref:glycoside hydrolase family 108 protein n=1 Tax=Frateuria sp. TaxID=2211372 RepID=UPI002D7E1E51|nr:glycosyl hydrolase 108 family protein [Frateuria sp.]HET6805337.1 glycosyl hydrolase 108 family protein [Frateuria sp.]